MLVLTPRHQIASMRCWLSTVSIKPRPKTEPTFCFRALEFRPHNTPWHPVSHGEPSKAPPTSVAQCSSWFCLKSLKPLLAKKAAEGGLKGKRKKQTTPSKPAQKATSVVALDPTKLALEPGCFVSPDGSEVHQIPMASVGPLAQGVVLTTMKPLPT